MKKSFTLFIFLFSIQSFAFAQVSPFIRTIWNQTCYFNADCPVANGGPCGYAVTGCVATASAQVLKYYGYPSQGMGGSHCNLNATSSCVNFSTETYNYALMKDTVTSADNEVAKLMYDLGVAVDMSWSATGSAAGDMSFPLKKYYGYSPQIYYRTVSSLTTSTLIQKMKAELNAGRPVIMESADHVYLVDGYNASDLFHCNFGWGGYCDGYYDITNVTNAGGNFNPVQVYFNVKPVSSEIELNVGSGYDTLVTDTLKFDAYGDPIGNILFEYSATTNWTLYSNSSWFDIIPANSNNVNDSTLGTPGYYPYNMVEISALSTGETRYGYVIIQTATKRDTIVVEQMGSITTSIVNQDNKTTINVFPNPANDHISVHVADNFLSGTILISDMQGKLIYTGSMDKQLFTIETSGFTNGMYLLRFDNGQSTYTEKIAIIH